MWIKHIEQARKKRPVYCNMNFSMKSRPLFDEDKGR
jgi:hypothetical protein